MSSPKFRIIVLMLLGLFSLGSVVQGQDVPGAPANLPFQRGASVVMYFNDTMIEQRTLEFFDDLDRRDLGINSLILTFPIYQDGLYATSLYENEQFTPSISNMRTFIQVAQMRGYSVWLKPLLDEGTLGGWRGAIQPGGDLGNLDALDAWFASYTTLMTKYAQLAHEQNIEGLVIGTELITIDKQMDKYTSRWNRLIADLRLVYAGKLSYAMNWSPQSLPGFAHSLDALMIDAFYDLTNLPNDASVDAIYNAWRYWEGTLIGYQRELNVPIIFAEVGTAPRQGSFREPWNQNVNQPADQTAQSRYYEATCRFAQDTGIAGTYWWAIDFYDHLAWQGDSLSYNFYDKLAEDTLRQCYKNIQLGETPAEG